ncbi:hypothetical protein ACRAWD_21285 [Caulobacter segnis]
MLDNLSNAHFFFFFFFFFLKKLSLDAASTTPSALLAEPDRRVQQIAGGEGVRSRTVSDHRRPASRRVGGQHRHRHVG